MPTTKLSLLFFVALAPFTVPLMAAPPRIPHRQDKPPGPALSPQEAIAKMTVPEGFTVELVAAEPDIVNPVAMTFDERGRIWVTESLEYPRTSPGPGRDRVKVLEDTDGDGRVDKTTIFAEGLNIPSGIAVGHGGVWVANSPDILFLPDADGDLKADTPEVVVTGFGRDDTHELPNSLTWGPDGWLYGLNGVFNRSQVEQNGKEFDFTCAMFRIHPRTREFELFCEGTSNPWGIAFDPEGALFASACVIDHLWHLTETGYYHRQGGPIRRSPGRSSRSSTTSTRRRPTAGFTTSTATPTRRSTATALHGQHPRQLHQRRRAATRTARPTSARRGPTSSRPTTPGSCRSSRRPAPTAACTSSTGTTATTATRTPTATPQGIDRLKGRLYRVRYKDTPRAAKFDLARTSDDQLIERLDSPNVYLPRHRPAAADRTRTTPPPDRKLEDSGLDDAAPRKTRMHALWALVGTGPLDRDLPPPAVAPRRCRLPRLGRPRGGQLGRGRRRICERIAALAGDRSPDVQLQVAIAAAKIDGARPDAGAVGSPRRIAATTR